MTTRIIMTVFCLSLIIISGCLASESTKPQLENEGAAKSEEDPNSTVLVTIGDKQLTLGQAKWGARTMSAKSLSEYADLWAQTELLFKEAQRLGITERQKEAFLADMAMKRAFSQHVIQETIDQIVVTDEEVKDYYDKNVFTDSLLNEPAVFGFSHIRVKGLREAENVIKFVKGGEDFNELAKKVSIAEDAEKGGKVTGMGRNLIAKRHGKEIRDALEKSDKRVGQLIGPLAVSDYYEVVRLERYRPAKAKPFEKRRPRIKMDMIKERRAASVDKLMSDVKEKRGYKVVKSQALTELEQEVSDAEQEFLERTK
ncbi:MAG: peptidylprolyl isomerase [Planctomycetota bacterium]|jgi:parvulin-like peptidyl-prolyl isomerase